jgi:hypothetical protein
MAHKSSVQCGDRFIKVGNRRAAPMIVKRLVELPDLPVHVQLVSEIRHGRPMTVSISALLDRSLFQPAIPANEA